MVTKAVVKSINRAGNRCIVRMPLFESASSPGQVLAEALISITPGLFNNIFVNDIVFVTFEENAIEMPIIIGKLFKGTASENNTPGGAGILDTLKVYSTAAVPASTTLFVYPPKLEAEYADFKTPKKVADYIKWLEKLTKGLISQLDSHFRCFKNWTQWQLRPENVEIDDGDIDQKYYKDAVVQQYQKEGGDCQICGKNCTKNKLRQYLKLGIDKIYPKT
jgi:hypothetical protein